MSTLTHDAGRDIGSSARTGIIWALASSLSFAWSGTFARPLLDAGWSVGLVITCRVLIAATALSVPALLAMRGRWGLVRAEILTVLGYGAIVVAMTQTSYYSAVARMDVGVALLIEFTAPVAVLIWLWSRHGQRPSRLTALGAVLTVVGLLLVIDIFSGASLDLIGIAWASLSMLGCAVYFVLSARASQLPPVALAALGMFTGGLILLALGLVGVLDLSPGTAIVHFRSAEVPWFVPLAGIGVLSTALAYAFGVVGGRLLGARLMSFVSLVEVVGAVVVAWALLGQAPSLVQAAGGLAILAGVVLVKLGEPAVEELAPVSVLPVADPVADPASGTDQSPMIRSQPA